MNNPLIIPCPYCHTDIAVPRALLTEVAAECSCHQCGKTVPLNEHVLISDDNPLFDDDSLLMMPDIADNNILSPHKSVESEASDMLIYDDMKIEDTTDPIIEYDSLEEMSAWINQLEIEPARPVHTNAAPQKSDIDITPESYDAPSTSTAAHLTDTDDANSVAAINSASINATSTVSKPSQSHTKKPMSSSSANNINVSITANNSSHNNENTWLETLLQEQDNSGQAVATNNEDSELSRMLTDPNISDAIEKEDARIRASKIQARMQPLTPSEPLPTISIVWSVGSILLLLLLLLQFVGFNLETLAKKPSIASKLQIACSVFPCQVPEANIQSFVINSPTYRPSRVKAAASFSDIRAQLINQSNKSQLLPHLKVSLYRNDAVLGEFIASPQQYLLGSESKLAAERGKSVMFTVPIVASQITSIKIEPLY